MPKLEINKKQIKPKPNWNGWTKLYKLCNPLIFTCCDCGLAHQFEFKSKKGVLYWKAKRHKEQTKLARSKCKVIIIT